MATIEEIVDWCVSKENNRLSKLIYTVQIIPVMTLKVFTVVCVCVRRIPLWYHRFLHSSFRRFRFDASSWWHSLPAYSPNRCVGEKSPDADERFRHCRAVDSGNHTILNLLNNISTLSMALDWKKYRCLQWHESPARSTGDATQRHFDESSHGRCVLDNEEMISFDLNTKWTADKFD